jgi:hypothetical protein
MRVLALNTTARVIVRRAMQALVLSLAALLLCLPVMAQSTTGRILGLVTDPSGAVVAGANVTVTDVQRGAKRTLVTDTSGQYVAPNLPPGLYTVRVEATGFKSAERPNIQLEVAKDVSVDVALETGEVT